MKALRFLPLLLLTVATLRAQSEEDLFDPNRLQQAMSARAARALQLDPKRIINESNSFLKEREPEMTAEEYALYEKVVTMLGTNTDLALKMLEGMVSGAEKPSPAFRFILGNAYYAAGRNDLCEASYRAAVEEFPSFLRAWNNLGVLYYSTDRFGEAVKCFSRSVALGDREPSTFGLLGYSLEKEGNPISAEVAYLQAISGDPTNPDWQEGLLRICMQGGMVTRAESIARNLIKARPTEARLWMTYAGILLSAGRKLEAIVVLETAAGTGVAGSDELLLLGDLYAEQNLHDEALATYARVLKPSPEAGEERLVRYARSLVSARKFAQAEATLAAIGEGRTPAGKTTVRLTRGELFAAQDRWADSRREYERVLAESPMNGPALIGVGQACAAVDDVARAELAFEAATRVPETEYRANLELANLMLKNRQYARTVECLERALRLQRTDAVADYLARVRTLVPKGT